MLAKKIYQFIKRRMRPAHKHDAALPAQQKEQPPADKGASKAAPTQQQKPPTSHRSRSRRPPSRRRVVITYAAFSSLLIILAAAAWVFKGSEFLAKQPLPRDTATPAAESKTPNAIQERTQEITQQPLPSDLASADTVNALATQVAQLNDEVQKLNREVGAIQTQPTHDDLTTPDTLNALSAQAAQLKDEAQQLNRELAATRIRQYLASSDYLVAVDSAERALSILHAARAAIAAQRDALGGDADKLLEEVDARRARVQHYLAYSPDKALALLDPLIDDVHTKLGVAPKRRAAATNTQTTNQDRNDGWMQKWTSELYAIGQNLVKVENLDEQRLENHRLLLRLLTLARAAALLDKEQQFNTVLNDALRLLDTMPQPPIARQKLEAVLSLKIIWQPLESPP